MNSELVEEDNFEKAEENVEGGGGEGKMVFQKGGSSGRGGDSGILPFHSGK